MPERVEEKRRLNKNDLATLGDYINAEFQRRQAKRKDLEALWGEIDRQVAMTPVARDIRSGTAKDWYPDTELPLQFNALEVIGADTRRLKFPRGTEWFSVSADVNDAYAKRWQTQREKSALLTGGGFTDAPDVELPGGLSAKGLAQQIDLDQETANVLSKVTMDHYHRQYDFRTQMDLFDAEMIKYGTGVVRVRPVKTSKFTMDFRGNKNDGMEGPAVIPCSIRDTYLEINPTGAHEGVMIAPLTLRASWQRLDSLLLAAKRGGKERGWMPKQINDMIPESANRMVRLIEGEGDFVIPKSSGSIYLPNFLITIAVGQGLVRVIRMRENPVPFRSYVVGNYMRDKVDSPYGASPLMKGQPLQEAGTAIMNDLLAASRFASQPAATYDRHDPNFAATGGPELFPGAMIPADSPNAVETLDIGNMAEASGALAMMLKLYEDVTGANDARRGAPVKSHTTTGGVELEASRGIARTDDFVTAVEQGPLTTILYMEWEIIKSVMKSKQAISVNAGGIEGWVNLTAADLPDNIIFNVHGSAGVLNERERAGNFLSASQFVIQMAAQAAQMGKPFEVSFEEIAEEAYKLGGIQNASRFIGGTQGGAGQPEAGPGVPGDVDGAAEDIIAQLQPEAAFG